MHQLEELDREIQEAKNQASKLPQIAARLFIAEQRTKQLEELCRDMYRRICYYNEVNDRLQFDNRMEELGLLEGEQNG